MARVWEGGALVELIGPGLKGQTSGGGGKRGKVGAFTPASRMRLMRKMARVRCDVLPQFITLTYADEFPTDPAVWKRDLDTLLKRTRRSFPKAAGFWKLEMKERQSGKNAGQLAPHFHILLWGVPLAWEDASNRQLHWRFALQTLDITNGKRLLKREVFDNGVWRNRESWGQAASGQVEVRSRKKRFKRHGDVIERETVEWWEYDEVAHLDQALVNLRKHGVGCGRVELREWLSLAWYEMSGREQNETAGRNKMRLRCCPLPEGRNLPPAGPGFEEAGAERRPTKSLALQEAPVLNGPLQNINSPNVSPYRSCTKPSTLSTAATSTQTPPPNS